ncbi:MAG: DNA-binding protein, partial [Giesbergeria sp.]|uniref:DNA-binding protein n=1 Tax=Giesbergeria sp. TaxID=2818473 RepID=UPI00260BC66A
MRPAAFSDEEIINAGQALLSTGRAITGFALRQKLGGGNPNRLKQVWDESFAQAAPAAPVVELPIEVADAVAHVSADLV